MHFNTSVVYFKGNRCIKKQIYTNFYFGLASIIVDWYNTNLGLDINIYADRNDEHILYVKIDMPILSIPKMITLDDYWEVQNNLRKIDKLYKYIKDSITEDILKENSVDKIELFCVDVYAKNCFKLGSQLYLLDLNGFAFACYSKDNPIHLKTNKKSNIVPFQNSVDKQLNFIKNYLYVI